MAQNRALTALLLVILVALGWTNDVTAQADVLGCTDVWACNFNPEATEDDGSCDYQSCIGCTNQYACNFEPGAIYNAGSCEYLSCVGCTVVEACNYDPEALIPNIASCEFASCVGCTILPLVPSIPRPPSPTLLNAFTRCRITTAKET